MSEVEEDIAADEAQKRRNPSRKARDARVPEVREAGGAIYVSSQDDA